MESCVGERTVRDRDRHERNKWKCVCAQRHPQTGTQAADQVSDQEGKSTEQQLKDQIQDKRLTTETCTFQN